MDNYNKDKIEFLKNKIVEKLVPLIKSDYILLDTPNHGNIGDQLIYEGELIFLKMFVKEYKFLYSANTDKTDYNKITAKATILLHGGGNFGDIYPKHQNFRLNIIRQYPDNPIIVLPQTVFYNDLSNLERESEVFNSHSNLYICVRDSKSYELLNKYIPSARLLLLPDMAFFINLKHFYQQDLNHKVLIMDRIDVENTNVVSKLDLVSTLRGKDFLVDVKDWPTYYNSIGSSLYLQFHRVRSFLFKFSVLNIPSDKIDRLLKDHYVEMGIKFMNQYDIVYTTRLHGLILAILLNKRVVLLDNSYGKLTSFYDAWLSDFDNVDNL